MFGFFKTVQNYIAKLQKNKAIWFSLITGLSFLGILICMYVVLTITSSAKVEVQKKMSEVYGISLESKMEAKKSTFEKILSATSADRELKKWIESNSNAELDRYKKDANEALVKNGHTMTSFDFYSIRSGAVPRSSINSVIQSKNSIFGLEILQDGVYFVYLKPTLNEQSNIVGVYEVREMIHTLRQDFIKDKIEFLFLLDKNLLNRLSIEAKNNKFNDIGTDYVIEQAQYDSVFNVTLAGMDKNNIDILVSSGKLDAGEYFRVSKKVKDLTGADIGYFVIGELSDKGGLISIVDGVTNTVTMVALGLITSILMFMF